MNFGQEFLDKASDTYTAYLVGGNADIHES